MPRDVMTPADLLGHFQMLNVRCVKCGRGGRYRVRALVRAIGLDGNIANWLSNLSVGCPRKNAVSFSDRCDVRCPDLTKPKRAQERK
jgi:hypothetical protein